MNYNIKAFYILLQIIGKIYYKIAKIIPKNTTKIKIFRVKPFTIKSSWFLIFLPR